MKKFQIRHDQSESPDSPGVIFSIGARMVLWTSFHGDEEWLTDYTVAQLPRIDFSANSGAATNDESSAIQSASGLKGSNKFSSLNTPRKISRAYKET